MNKMNEETTAWNEEKKSQNSNKISYETEQRLTVGTPHWVKIFGIIALFIVLLVVVLHLIGNISIGHGSNMSIGLNSQMSTLGYLVLQQ